MEERDYQQELERRIALIEQKEENGSDRGARMTRKDYIGVVLFAAVCLVGIIMGAFI